MPDIDASEAVTLWLKRSPLSNEAAFTARYGGLAEQARAVVLALTHEASRLDPDWSRLTLAEAGDWVRSVMSERHPDLSDAALECIANSYTYLMR